MVAKTYPGFDLNASQLSAFGLSLGIFIISLKNGDIINYSPTDVADFKKWLSQNGVRDVARDKGYSLRRP